MAVSDEVADVGVAEPAHQATSVNIVQIVDELHPSVHATFAHPSRLGQLPLLDFVCEADMSRIDRGALRASHLGDSRGDMLGIREVELREDRVAVCCVSDSSLIAKWLD